MFEWCSFAWSRATREDQTLITTRFKHGSIGGLCQWINVWWHVFGLASFEHWNDLKRCERLTRWVDRWIIANFTFSEYNERGAIGLTTINVGPALVWIRLLAYLCLMQWSTEASFKCFKWQMSSLRSKSLEFIFSMSSSSTYICSPLCSSSTKTLPGSPFGWFILSAAQKPPRWTSQTFSPFWTPFSPLSPFSCFG